MLVSLSPCPRSHFKQSTELAAEIFCRDGCRWLNQMPSYQLCTPRPSGLRSSLSNSSANISLYASACGGGAGSSALRFWPNAALPVKIRQAITDDHNE